MVGNDREPLAYLTIYDPSVPEIVMCYELVALSADLIVEDILSDEQRLVSAGDGAGLVLGTSLERMGGRVVEGHWPGLSGDGPMNRRPSRLKWDWTSGSVGWKQ